MTSVEPRLKGKKRPRRLPDPDVWTEEDGYAFVDERSRHLCEGDTPACPRGRHWGTEHHHKAGRRGRDPHNPTNLLMVCHAGHVWIGEHPIEAKSLGLSSSRLGQGEG